MLKSLRYVFVFLLILASFSVFAEESQTVEQIRAAADKGDALAQAKLGSLYYLGANFKLEPNARFKTKQKYKAIAHLLPGIAKNDKEAADWMLKSANQGFVDAEVFIAALYDRGIGISQSGAKATDYYKKASEHGNEMAQAVLGPYARSRLTASKNVPLEYSLKILNTN